MKPTIKFGTDGWRAIIADEFTFENVKTVSQAIGKMLLKNSNTSAPIIIGYDTRFLSDEFAKTCSNELQSLGFKTLLSSMPVPTPVIAFWAAKHPYGSTNGAIQFTASHNPPNYCGIKYITNYGGPAPVEVTDEITKYLNDIDRRDVVNNVSTTVTFEPLKHYALHIENLINFDVIKKAKLTVVYDPLYGAGNGYLDTLLKEAGCTTYTIHNKKDPMFGGLLPEPREENLNDLKTEVKLKAAKLGLATDGDADRISALDQNGIFYSPNKIAAMLLRHLYKNKKLNGKVVRTVSTTHLLDHLAEKYGLEVTETKVGFKWICEEMRKGPVILGAEESGGISISGHVPDKDAVLAGMLLTEMLAYEKKSIKEIYEDTLKEAEWSCINDKIDLHLDEEPKKQLIEKFKDGGISRYGSLKIKSINTMEGVKYVLEDGSWFLARASGTEPMARVYFEATSEKILDAMKNVVTKIIEEVKTPKQCQKLA